VEQIIGRVQEQILLEKVIKSKEAELIVVYGRRRVGKTFLIKNVFEQQIAFEYAGIHNIPTDQQLENFSIELTKSASSGLPVAKPENWIQAFTMLANYLTPQLESQRKAIFLDEFPWINTPRSGFLPAFENFWNIWASRQKNLIVIICGSAAAWMIQKIIRNRGGLHNRITRSIRLLPFNLAETETYFRERMVNLSRYQILQLYMAMGGIPQYLNQVEVGESAIQAIDRICLTKNGLLNHEFKDLYQSLFDHASSHIDVIRALARKGKGLTRGEIIKACKLTSGGGATAILEELTESGFITPYIPFNKKAKDSIYKLTDEYSLFYLKFIENNKSTGSGAWVKLSMGSSWKSWSGYAFENICMMHVTQIKKGLGVENVYSESSVWYHKSKQGEKGAQVDLLIDRQDHCINVCEIKFSTDTFEITKAYAKELESKQRVFRVQTKTRKTLFLTMLTTYGVSNVNHYTGLVHNEVTMDALFL
jgi:AAA+ ATPase superfamily predicted ATPase